MQFFEKNKKYDFFHFKKITIFPTLYSTVQKSTFQEQAFAFMQHAFSFTYLSGALA